MRKFKDGWICLFNSVLHSENIKWFDNKYALSTTKRIIQSDLHFPSESGNVKPIKLTKLAPSCVLYSHKQQLWAQPWVCKCPPVDNIWCDFCA